MKALRILARVGLGLFLLWGLIAFVHTWNRQPGDKPFLFWYVLPYPVLIALTMAIIAMCARRSRPTEAGFSWFAVVVGAAAGIGLTTAVNIGLLSIISWAYFGHVALTSHGSTDPMSVGIVVAVFAACYIWAGAISAALSPSRPISHALVAGTAVLLWSSAIALLQPLGISLLVAALTLPIPLAALGARLAVKTAT